MLYNIAMYFPFQAKASAPAVKPGRKTPKSASIKSRVSQKNSHALNLYFKLLSQLLSRVG